jgi:hypothetical protein
MMSLNSPDCPLGHKADMPTALRDVRSQGQSRKHVLALSFSAFDPEETSPGRGASRGEIRDPLLSDADRFYRGGSPFAAKSSPISIRWSLNLERTLRHL